MVTKFLPYIFALIFIALSLTFMLTHTDFQVEDQPAVLEKAKDLPASGILKENEDGYVYVKVSSDYVSDLIPLIHTSGTITPPRAYKSVKGVGTHISVIYIDERHKYKIKHVKDIGKNITFTIKGIHSITQKRSGRKRKVWLVAVNAPELEKLRESYGLSPLLKNHDFHITIGYEDIGPTRFWE